MKTPEATGGRESGPLRYVDYYSTLSLADFMALIASGWNGGVHDISEA